MTDSSSTPIPQVELRNALFLDLNKVTVEPSETYPMVGVLSFGRGLFHRVPVSGSNTSYGFFYRLKAEHIVMSQLFGWEGALAISSSEFDGNFLSPQFPTFLCNDAMLDRRYLGWHLRRRSVWDDLAKRASGMGDRRRTLNPDALLSCTIPLPPLTEQRRIVARIEALAERIETTRKLRQTASQQADGLYAAILGKELDHGRHSTWQLVRLPEVLARSPQNGRSVYGDTGTRSVRLLSLRAVQSGSIHVHESKPTSISDDELGRFQLQQGDFLVVRGNGSKALVGRAGMFSSSDEDVIFSDLLIRIVPEPSRIDPRFLLHYWNSPLARDWFEETAKTTSGIWKVNQQHLYSMSIPLPPLPEQTSIVERLDDAKSRISAVRRLQIETDAELAAVLPAVLDRAFRGEL